MHERPMVILRIRAMLWSFAMRDVRISRGGEREWTFEASDECSIEAMYLSYILHDTS